MSLKKFILRLIDKIKVFSWASKQLMTAAPKKMCVLTFLIVLQGISPAASLFFIQKLINWILLGSAGLLFPWGVILGWGAMLAISTIITPIINVVRIHLNEKVLTHCNVLLMEKANRIEGLAPFEDSKLYDHIQFLKNEASRRPLNFVFIITGLVKDITALISILIIISSINIWTPIFILFACLPHAFSTYWMEKQTWTDALFRSPEARRLTWLSALTLDERYSKEIRLFNFGGFLVTQYKKIASIFHRKSGDNRRKKSIGFMSLSLLSAFGNVGVFIFVILQGKTSALATGSIIIAIQAIVMIQLEINNLIQDIGMLTPTVLFFEKFKTFLQTEFQCFKEKRQNAATKMCGVKHEIRFENVSFSYPYGKQILKNLSFSIPVGQRVALVGDNGAGKSTIVKLLSRFYDPNEGRILIDGTDLRDIEITDWRNKLSVVFQDFGQYHLSAKENIGISRSSYNHEDVALAAKKGGFDSVATKLPQGLDSMLGKEFGGTSLSGGEWQKLAMSRAFLREADILILDEPTASLDPKSEYEVFQRFAQNTENKTTLFITHRLGSVKMADRILVLKNGELIEEGCHQDLINKRGEYFYLFSLQASRYTNNLDVASP